MFSRGREDCAGLRDKTLAAIDRSMPKHPLAYSASRPSRTRLVRRIALVTVVAAVALAAVQYRAPLINRVRRAYWERQCLARVDPGGTVVWEEDPISAKQLLAAGRHRAVYQSTTCPVVYDFQPWREYSQTPPTFPTDAVFCHRRQATGGVPRLVVVGHVLEPGGVILSTVIEPGGLWGTPRDCVPELGAYRVLHRPSDSRLQLLAGRVDPTDPSRFVLPYRMDGEGGEIEGRLMPDDTVRFRVRTGPATMPDEYYERMERAFVEHRQERVTRSRGPGTQSSRQTAPSRAGSTD